MLLSSIFVGNGNSLSSAARTSPTSPARRRSSPNYSRATKRRIEKRLFSARAEKTLGANGADGITDIEGKVARVATSKLGNERVSNSTSARSTMPCSNSARYRCPLSRHGSTASSLKMAKALTRKWSELVNDRVSNQTKFYRSRHGFSLELRQRRILIDFPVSSALRLQFYGLRFVNHLAIRENKRSLTFNSGG